MFWTMNDIPTAVMSTERRGAFRSRRYAMNSIEQFTSAPKADRCGLRLLFRDFTARGRAFQPSLATWLRKRLAGCRLPRRVDERCLRARRQQRLQVTALAGVDREEQRCALRAGQVAVLVQGEAPDQAVVHLRLEDVGDHAGPGAVRLGDGVKQHLGGLRAEDRVRI